MQWTLWNLLGKLKCAVLLAGALLSPGLCSAQARAASARGEVSVAVTYAAAHSRQVDGGTFWLGGGSVSTNARFANGFGLAASATGLHAASNSQHAPLDLFTIAFGPSYTVNAGRHLSFYGEALLGEAHGFHSVFSTGSGAQPSLVYGITDSANALALQTGGGVDLRLGRHTAIRLAQVDYLRTQLPNGGSNLQNNLRVAAGIVLRFPQ